MTSNSRWKNRVRAYAAAHGLTYQQAHQALTEQARPGRGFTADPDRWTWIGAGRYQVEFGEHGLGGHDIEPFHLEVSGAEDLREQIGRFALGRGWFTFVIEVDGLAGRIRLGAEPGRADLIGVFTLTPGPARDVAELPGSFSREVHELLDVVQVEFDCTVDALTFVRGAHAGEIEYVALIYRAGTQMFHLLHMADHDRRWRYTLSGGWPLAREKEAVAAFQAKVGEHMHR